MKTSLHHSGGMRAQLAALALMFASTVALAPAPAQAFAAFTSLKNSQSVAKPQWDGMVVGIASVKFIWRKSQSEGARLTIAARKCQTEGGSCGPISIRPLRAGEVCEE